MYVIVISQVCNPPDCRTFQAVFTVLCWRAGRSSGTSLNKARVGVSHSAHTNMCSMCGVAAGPSRFREVQKTPLKCSVITTAKA